MTAFRAVALSLTTLLPSCSCFIGSTRIQTPGGRKPISELKVGDWVLSQNLVEDRVVCARVTRLFKHSKRGFGRIAGTNLVGVTANHPIYVPDRRKYLRADQIGSPTQLLRYDEGQTSAFATLGYEPLPSFEEPVFNIEVEKTHNYFAEDILVHNKTPAGVDKDTETERSRDCGDPILPFAEACGDTVILNVGPPMTVMSIEAACADNGLASGGSSGDAICPLEDALAEELTRDVLLYLMQATVDGESCENYDLVVSDASGPALLEFLPGLDRCTVNGSPPVSSHAIADSETRIPIPKMLGGITFRLSPDGPEPLIVRLALSPRNLVPDP